MTNERPWDSLVGNRKGAAEQPRPAAPSKPPVRWTTDPDGRTVRAYACKFCRDMGVVVIPAYRPDETDEDLLMVKPPPGKTYAYKCPNCQGDGASMWSAQDVDQWQRDRAARWFRARKVQLEEDAAREALARMPRVPEVAKAMPSLSTFEQESIAAEMRAAKGGSDD